MLSKKIDRNIESKCYTVPDCCRLFSSEMILNLIVSLLKHKFPDVANITTGELHEVLSTDKEDTCLLVDTRQKSEVSVSAIK